ncbi:MAG TPA: hypothetical protein PK156_29680 [Polyangium sp.]|nr:hypothetical protein [Polyangium sp.]
MNQPPTVYNYRSFRFLPPLAVMMGISTAADAAPPASAADPATAAQAHIDEWNAQGKAACEAKAATCSKLAEYLYNAAAEYQKAGDRNKAIAARLQLIDPRYHLESTDIAKKALFQLAEDYKALSEYAKSAEFYEKAALKASSMPEAPDGLVDATIFRLSLGEIDLAVKNAELYDKLFGAAKPEMAVTVWLGIGRTLVDAQRFEEAKPILIKIMPRVDKVGAVRDRFLAHAALGRTFSKLNDKQGAEHEYDIVRALWKNTEIQKRLSTDAEADPRNLGKVLNAVGEALFFFAEQKRQAVDAIRYPEYKGPAEMDQMLKHINTKVVDWIKQKKPAIEEAEQAYLQIVNLQPAPPPRWLVASSSRVGAMWAKFVAEFRAAPIPDAWKKGGPVPGTQDLTFEDIRKEYYAKLDEASEPQKQKAKAAYKQCVGFSAKFEYKDEFSRSCENWLEKNYRKEFVRVDEFIPAIRMPSTPFSPPSVLPDPRTSK